MEPVSESVSEPLSGFWPCWSQVLAVRSAGRLRLDATLRRALGAGFGSSHYRDGPVYGSDGCCGID